MSDHATGSGPRYHALDCVRASAMLLGVFYHAIQTGMFFGGNWGRDQSPLGMLSSFTVMNWLHSFRMPLFFLISGFFCHMMHGKYGTARYLAKRWWRIGAPMVVALFVLSGLHLVTRPDPWGGGPGRGPGEARPQAAEPGQAAGGDPEAPGFGSPGPGGGPGFDLSQFAPRIGRVSKFLFGRYASYFMLGHLWFLWYLLVFTSIAPFAAAAVGRLLTPPQQETSDRVGLWAVRHGVVPLALGLLSVPALMQTREIFGWSLGMAEAIFGVFPDVLFQYQKDMPFYFAYFLAGWWLYRLRGSLPDVARWWWRSLIVGLVAFAVAGGVSAAYSSQTGLPHYRLIRLGGYAVYGVASAYLAWGFLGVFQRYLDRPTRVGRYLADTAFWVYLVHQEILGPVVGGIRPLHLYWWAQALLGSVLATAVSLILFEIVVRPTPLNLLFGATGPRRAKPVAPTDEGPAGSLTPETGEAEDAGDPDRRPSVPAT